MDEISPANRISRHGAFAIVLLLITVSCSKPITPPEPLPDIEMVTPPDIFEFRALLENGDYEALDRILDDYQKAYEERSGSEITVEFAYAAFMHSDPAFVPYLDAWVDAMPKAYTPYMARGSYYKAVASVQRGSKFARDTSEEQFAAMRETQELALADINRVLEIKPTMTLAYSRLISIASTRGDDGLKRRAFEQGLQADPSSYLVRRDMLYFLLPRWGGGYKRSMLFFFLPRWRGRYEKIENLLDDTEKHLDENAELAPLMGIWITPSRGRPTPTTRTRRRSDSRVLLSARARSPSTINDGLTLSIH